MRLSALPVLAFLTLAAAQPDWHGHGEADLAAQLGGQLPPVVGEVQVMGSKRERARRDHLADMRLQARIVANSTTTTTQSSSSSSTSAKASTSSSTTTSLKTTTTSVAATTTTKSTSTKTSTSTSSTPTAFNAAATTAVAAACSPRYVGATQITGTGTLPKPSTFVKKAANSQQLTLNGARWRMVGVNMYWLCNDENVAPVNAPTDKGRVREAMAQAVAMGATTVRTLSCGVSVGSPYSVEPTRGSFGASQWDLHDYVIYAAKMYGLRVIMTLTDDYNTYYGSKYTFLNWRGLNTGNYGKLFYTDANVIADFKVYTQTLLNHVNVYTKVAWKNEPAIVAWETGNELGAYIGKEGYPPVAWTSAITAFIKQNAPNQLVMDGSDGFYNYSTKATAPGLQLSTVDIMTDHGYPRNIGLLQAEIPLAKANQKTFVIGEYDWTNNNGGDSLASYLSFIESQAASDLLSGDLIWSVQGHDAQCCNWVLHNDGYSMYYPNGHVSTTVPYILQIVQHFYRMSGRPVPSTLPGVACPQPGF